MIVIVSMKRVAEGGPGCMYTAVQTNDRGEVKYPVTSINVIKTHGKSMRESTLVEGYALKAGRAAQGQSQCLSVQRASSCLYICEGSNFQTTYVHTCAGIDTCLLDASASCRG